MIELGLKRDSASEKILTGRNNSDYAVSHYTYMALNVELFTVRIKQTGIEGSIAIYMLHICDLKVCVVSKKNRRRAKEYCHCNR